MKQLARLLSLLILVSAGIFFSNCGGSDDKEPSAEETQLNALKANGWILSSVTFEGDPADQFDGSGLKLTISGNYSEGGTYSYSFSSGIQIDASPFPESGKWRFGSPVTSKIIRLDSEISSGSYDDIEMGYEINGSTLRLTLDNYPEGANFVVGRTASVGGDWVFTFNKQ